MDLSLLASSFENVGELAGCWRHEDKATRREKAGSRFRCCFSSCVLLICLCGHRNRVFGGAACGKDPRVGGKINVSSLKLELPEIGSIPNVWV